MARKQKIEGVFAVFPISDSEIVLLCSHPVDPAMENPRRYRSESGLSVKSVRLDAERPTRIVLETEKQADLPLVTDQIKIRNFRSSLSTQSMNVVSPRFIQNVHEAMELKVPYISESFPYASDLVGFHVSVACCTGCNGGIHDRNLVVLNHHIGGAWSGIWVQTGKTIEAPYPRWQKVLCAGGVIAELNGSLTVIDQGWMEIYKQDEIPHHAPPPLPIETADLPAKRTSSLACKGLDGAWVQFQDITIESAVFMEAQERVRGAVNLPRTEIAFRDKSGEISMAYLYQPTGHQVTAGQQVKLLRGFVHAEKPGVYVLLSDKEEDIIL